MDLETILGNAVGISLLVLCFGALIYSSKMLRTMALLDVIYIMYFVGALANYRDAPVMVDLKALAVVAGGISIVLASVSWVLVMWLSDVLSDKWSAIWDKEFTDFFKQIPVLKHVRVLTDASTD